jgi:single-strand DNA-binding protein
MNEITISGNVTADPVLRYGRDSDTTAFLAFTVAVNRTYWDRARNARIEQPAVFHSVVAFRGLAENAAATLRKGMAVTVTGQFADDSYVPDGSDRVIRRHRLEAQDIAVSLRWATATVTRTATSIHCSTAVATVIDDFGCRLSSTSPCSLVSAFSASARVRQVSRRRMSSRVSGSVPA